MKGRKYILKGGKYFLKGKNILKGEKYIEGKKYIEGRKYIELLYRNTTPAIMSHHDVR